MQVGCGVQQLYFSFVGLALLPVYELECPCLVAFLLRTQAVS